MIFLTGDVHSMDLESADQEWLASRGENRVSEVDCALKFADIAREYEVPVTLFVTGLAAEQECSKVRELASNPFVEVGGHTWNSLQPDWKRWAYWRAFGSYYGPRRVQKRDIKATIGSLESTTEQSPTCWRTHSYRGDDITYDVLSNHGIRVVSDELGRKPRVREIRPGLFSAPINVPPDHEHLDHGFVTRRRVSAERLLQRSLTNLVKLPPSLVALRAFGKELLKRLLSFPMPLRPFGDWVGSADEWLDRVVRAVESNLEADRCSVLLVHPACMEVVDGMQLFERLLDELEEHEFGLLSELPEMPDRTA